MVARLRWITHALLAVPLAWFAWQFYLAYTHHPHSLGANPVQYAIRFLGLWALRILLLGLAITPLSRLKPLRFVASVRRAVGLWGFTYAAAHMLMYQAFELAWSLDALWQDILKRTYIALGMAAFVLLIPLVVTSPVAMLKRLGARTWKRLHRLVYVIVLLGCVHFMFMVKGNQPAPKLYLLILAGLLAFRIVWYWRARSNLKASS